MYSMNLKINWEHKRCKHIIERMFLRGISMNEIKEALIKGQKKKQIKSSLTETFYAYYSVVYEEYIYKGINTRKIYPVTVKIW